MTWFIEIAENLDVSAEKRSAYLSKAIRDFEFDGQSQVRASILYDAWLGETGPNCEGVIPSPAFDAWLNEKAKEADEEFAKFTEALRKKWALA